MRISATQLRSLIQEEIHQVLAEAPLPAGTYNKAVKALEATHLDASSADEAQDGGRANMLKSELGLNQAQAMALIAQMRQRLKQGKPIKEPLSWIEHADGLHKIATNYLKKRRALPKLDYAIDGRPKNSETYQKYAALAKSLEADMYKHGKENNERALPREDRDKLTAWVHKALHIAFPNYYKPQEDQEDKSFRAKMVAYLEKYPEDREDEDQRTRDARAVFQGRDPVGKGEEKGAEPPSEPEAPEAEAEAETPEAEAEAETTEEDPLAPVYNARSVKDFTEKFERLLGKAHPEDVRRQAIASRNLQVARQFFQEAAREGTLFVDGKLNLKDEKVKDGVGYVDDLGLGATEKAFKLKQKFAQLVNSAEINAMGAEEDVDYLQGTRPEKRDRRGGKPEPEGTAEPEEEPVKLDLGDEEEEESVVLDTGDEEEEKTPEAGALTPQEIKQMGQALAAHPGSMEDVKYADVATAINNLRRAGELRTRDIEGATARAIQKLEKSSSPAAPKQIETIKTVAKRIIDLLGSGLDKKEAAAAASVPPSKKGKKGKKGGKKDKKSRRLTEWQRGELIAAHLLIENVIATVKENEAKDRWKVLAGI